MTTKKLNYKKKLNTLSALTLNTTLICLGSPMAIAANSYNIVDLSKVTATGGFVPSKIGLVGSRIQVVGNESNIPLIYDVTSGTTSSIQDLADGSNFIGAADINANGQVAGKIVPAGSTLISVNNPLFHIGVRNSDGSYTDLGGFNAPYNYSTPYPASLNALGQVSGTAITTSLCENRAFTSSLTDTNLSQIDSLLNATSWIAAFDINALSQTVGKSSTDGGCVGGSPFHAYIANNGVSTDLHDPAWPTTLSTPAYGYSSAQAINDKGLAAGYYAAGFAAASRLWLYGTPIWHAVMWDTASGNHVDVANPALSSVLNDINNLDEVVGTESTYGVVGSTAKGLTNLNSLAVGLPSGWNISSAFDISDSGHILAIATDVAAAQHYLLLAPSTTPVITLPAAPSALAATAASTSQINLSWIDNATNETGQILERCQGAGCSSFSQIATLTIGMVAYNDTGLTAGTSYSYRVRAQNSAGYSAYSNIATIATSAATPVATAPNAPSNLAATAVSRSKVSLSWLDNATNESKYEIERCKGVTCTGFNKINSVKANVTSYSDSNLSKNTTYRYRVRAVNNMGKSAYTNIFNVITLP